MCDNGSCVIPMLVHIKQHIAATKNRPEQAPYRCCTIYPNDGCLLGVRQLFIDEDTKFQVQQQRGARHEGENEVQDKVKCIKL